MTSPEEAQTAPTLTFGGSAIGSVEQPVIGRTAIDVSSLSNHGLLGLRPWLRRHCGIPVGHHFR